MSNCMTRIKKIVVFALSALLMSSLNLPANADDSTPAASTAASSTAATAGSTASGGSAGGGAGGGNVSLYLAEIAQYTNGTLTAVNSLPQYLTVLAQLAIQWVSPDTSNETAKLQGTFATYATQLSQSTFYQNQLSVQMAQDLFGSSATATSLPYANDLDFNSILGSPFFSPDPRTQNGGAAVNIPLNYTENAAAVNFPHVIPGTTWTGAKADQVKYSNYYKAVMSVQTYDAYVLGQLYGDVQSQVASSTAALLSQASTSDWFTQVASEQIGIVLRQILMYDSQILLLMSQLLQTERSMLATQAMTNTLLIANGASNEALLLQKAVQKGI